MIWVIVSFSLAAAGVKSPTALEYLWNIYCKLLQSVGRFALESANYQQRDKMSWWCNAILGKHLGKHLGYVFLERRSKKRWSQIQVRRHLLIQIRSRKRESVRWMQKILEMILWMSEPQQVGPNTERKCKWRILKSISELNWKVWIQIIHTPLLSLMVSSILHMYI